MKLQDQSSALAVPREGPRNPAGQAGSGGGISVLRSTAEDMGIYLGVVRSLWEAVSQREEPSSSSSLS